MRRTALVNATGLTAAAAQQALDAQHIGGQVDIDAVFHFSQTLKSLPAGTKVGLTVLGEAITLTLTGPGQAELNAASEAGHGSPKKQSMALQVKGNETSIALRIICDGGAIEVFAMHGRAGVSARAAKSSGEIGVVVLAGEPGAVVPPSVDVAVFPLAFLVGKGHPSR